MNEDTFATLFTMPILCFSTVIFPLIWCAVALISVIGIIIWIFMLIDVIKRGEKDFPGKDTNQKLLWVLVIVFTSYIGSLIYYFLVYRKQGAAK